MIRTPGNKEFWLGALRTEGAAFRVAVVDADPDTPVPSCPEWTVADLVSHLGKAYQYIGEVVSRGAVDPPERRLRDQPGPPAGADLIAWWDERYQRLLSLLDGLDPELPAWNRAPQRKRVGFWQRHGVPEGGVVEGAAAQVGDGDGGAAQLG